MSARALASRVRLPRGLRALIYSPSLPLPCAPAAHKITSTGADFYAVNPKGNVPTLTLADGSACPSARRRLGRLPSAPSPRSSTPPCAALLNEGAATLQWIADQAPESGLAPAYGTSGRYTLINRFVQLYGPSFLLHKVAHSLSSFARPCVQPQLPGL